MNWQWNNSNTKKFDWNNVPQMSQSEIDYWNQGKEDFQKIGNWFSSAFQNIGNWLTKSNPIATAIQEYFDLNGSQAAANQLNAQMQLQKDAQAFNSAEADKAREWEKMMSDTAVQRYAADLRSAGLNPWLAVQNGGQGASTGSGQAASSGEGSASMANNRSALALAGIIGTAFRAFMTKGK